MQKVPKFHVFIEFEWLVAKNKNLPNRRSNISFVSQ